jgi:glyoxylase-like metal-dependent hydrolase (beta-lactamase superfamily II)
MSLQPVVPGVYQISFGMVSAYLIDDDGLTLIDTGIPGSAAAILDAVRELGKQPKDIGQIILTHLHADHVGSAKAVQQASGAKVYMHPLDTDDFLKGNVMRPVKPAPGLVNQIIVRSFMNRREPMAIEPVAIDAPLSDGQELPFASGLKVIHTPGHTAGHVVLLWPRQGGVLFGADACGNMFGLSISPIYEDYPEGLHSLKKISGLTFDTACMAHGKPIRGSAAEKFRRKWG